ncbi:MAG: PSD1 and planctomycete cytochrome C domain-containing protein [Planctomycetaceae bacterium]
MIPKRRTQLRRCVAVAALAIARMTAAADVDFDRDVRPLLAVHCVACHGGVKKAGGLSFLARDAAVVAGDSGAEAIVPGDPTTSEVVRRVTSADESERMPPPEHGRQLTPAEVATLRAWIEAGAPWRAHWSFDPPRDPSRPVVPDASWPRVPLDTFVAARLAAEGLAPAPAAGPAEWLRRVSLDLTGLPPSLEEFEGFVADGGGAAEPQSAAAARERVVDRLLASPRFGERWASVWLDLARYADTFGFEKDPTRPIWPWRDWVIRAFNDDMPFDRFTIRQLAGDLLPEATTDDLLATAFHRNTQTNTEGGTDDEEYRVAAVIDRVNTTWTAWQATTFGCVQCHDHPYDPFAHDDYYRFLAYFDGTRDCDLNDEFPTLPVPADRAERDRVADLLRRIDGLRDRQHARGLGVAAAAHDWQPLDVLSATTTGGTLAIAGPGRLEAGGTLPIGVRYDLEVRIPPGTTALRLTIGLDDGRSVAAPPQRGAVASFVELTLPPPATEASTGDAKPEPVRLAIADVVPDLIDGPFDARTSLEKNADGFGGYPVLDRPRWCVFLLDDPAAVPADGCVRLSITQSAAANVGTQACPLRHFQLCTSSDPRWREIVELDTAREERRDLREARARLAKADGPRVPVMLDQRPDARRITHVFTRGNRLEPGSAVAPAVPGAVAAPGEMPADRLGMAQWLVGDANPLTARVLANRLWAELFGAGIVETLEDFGSSGARPTHPDLLDHLAVRLVREHRWSVKRFLKDLALSATYGQTAAASVDLTARDPRNRLLTRGPRSRLTAEMVRDQALAWSGRLSGTMFGPPVYPPQPDGIWKTVYSGATWKTSQGEDRFRRSIYTFVKRTAGYPAWLAFDAPSRDLCTARRFPTNTPLQPLATLNDPMMVELAAGFAARMAAAGTTPREQITHGCRVVTLAPPPETMIAPLLALHEAAETAAAGTPDDPAATDREPQHVAPLTVVAMALLNLDMAFVR